jgi:hypothetical protein
VSTSTLALDHFATPTTSLPTFLPGKPENSLFVRVGDTLAAGVKDLLATGADDLPADRASSSRAGERMVLCADESRADRASLVGAVCRADAFELRLLPVESRCKLGVDHLAEFFPFEDVAAALREAEAFVVYLGGDHAFEALDAVQHVAGRFPGVV